MSADEVADLVQAWNDSAESRYEFSSDSASWDAIAEAEQRCGLTFPSDYRAFLHVCDGWPDTGDSWAVDALRPAARIEPFAQHHGETIEAWADVDPASTVVAVMQRGVVISDGEAVVLLDPGTALPGSGEVACFVIDNDAPGISQGPASFTDVLRELIKASQIALEPGGYGDAADVERTVAFLTEQTAAALHADDPRPAWDTVLDRNYSGTQLAFMTLAQWLYFCGPTNEASSVTFINSVYETPPAHGEDPVLVAELAPTFATLSLRERYPLRYEIGRAKPPAVAAVFQAYDQLQPVTTPGSYSLEIRLPDADFSYTPAFATQIEQARLLHRQGDDTGARALILEALPLWTPRAPHHIVPMGLLYDPELAPIVLTDISDSTVSINALHILDTLLRARGATSAS